MKTLEIVRNADGLAMTDNAGEVKKEFTNIKIFETKRMVHECQIHGEVPCDVFVFNGKPSPTGCPICEREEEKRLEAEEELRRKEKEREAQIERYHEMNVEAEYWDKTMDDYKPIVESQRKAKAAVEKLIAQKHGKVILLGTNGSGKTHLGTMTTFHARNKQPSFKGLSERKEPLQYVLRELFGERHSLQTWTGFGNSNYVRCAGLQTTQINGRRL